MLVLKFALFVSASMAFGMGALAWLRAPDRSGRRWALGATVLALALVAAGVAIVVVPAGRAGVRVSQFTGTSPGPLYAGVHLVRPLIERIAVYDVRDRIVATGDPARKQEPLVARSKEGLAVGLALSVRYRLDPRRLDYVESNLPADVDQEIVAPAVAGVFRDLLPRYEVREIFATRREEIRERAAEALTQKLAPDAVVVREVVLRDVILPPDYAKGLEALLVKEQERDQMDVELKIKEQEVRQAGLEAEAEKVRQVKAAEAQARVRLVEAKAETDAMQHTLMLKQKQIEQARLESEARKAARLKDAEAAAEAAVIQAKGDVERDRLTAEAEANRIRVTSSADSERMTLEARALKENPLLIQKIVAERLSDKLQIIMVPADGHNFFTNDVLRGLEAQVAAPDPGQRRAANQR